jgi:hypothetical protein
MPDPQAAGALPAYVDYPSVQTLPGPIAFTNVRISAFYLAADGSALQALCDRLIAAPSGGRVRFTPVLSSVIMSFTEFPHSVFVNFADRGVATERELSFAIPGMFTRFERQIPVEIGFALFMPFLFLDNSVALMTGRENYGFFKQTGQIGLPDDPGSAGFSADVYGCPSFSPTAQWGQQRLITLRRVAEAGLGSALGLPWADPMSAARKLAAAMQAAADGATLAPAMFADFLTGSLPQIFLKQFRDVADSTRACYQAVTLAGYKVTRLIGVSVEDRYAIDLRALDSTPVAAALGLVPTTETDLGMRVEMDMQLENGRVLWQA